MFLFFTYSLTILIFLQGLEDKEKIDFLAESESESEDEFRHPFMVTEKALPNPITMLLGSGISMLKFLKLKVFFYGVGIGVSSPIFFEFEFCGFPALLNNFAIYFFSD